MSRLDVRITVKPGWSAEECVDQVQEWARFAYGSVAGATLCIPTRPSVGWSIAEVELSVGLLERAVGVGELLSSLRSLDSVGGIELLAR